MTAAGEVSGQTDGLMCKLQSFLHVLTPVKQLLEFLELLEMQSPNLENKYAEVHIMTCEQDQTIPRTINPSFKTVLECQIMNLFLLK